MSYDKKKVHLVPILIQDMVHIYNSETNHVHKDVLTERLEVIRDYISFSLEAGKKKK